MTPGINIAKRAKIFYRVHEYCHDPKSESYGAEATEKMGVAEERIFKTLVISVGPKDLIVGVVPVASSLHMKRIAKAVGAKKAGMAEPSDVEKSTGYVLGGVSPLGQKRKLVTIIDSSAQKYPTIFVSAGRRGLELEVKPDDLMKLTHATFVDICR